MKKELLLSSLFATSLVSIGQPALAANSLTHLASDTGTPTATAGSSASTATAHESELEKHFQDLYEQRLAQADVFSSDQVQAGSKVSILLLPLDSLKENGYQSKAGDLEMVVQVRASNTGNIEEYGAGFSDDVSFYLKPLDVDATGKNGTFIGFTCNSSQGCEEGETFFVRVSKDNLNITQGKYNQGNNYMPAFIYDKTYKKEAGHSN